MSGGGDGHGSDYPETDGNFLNEAKRIKLMEVAAAGSSQHMDSSILRLHTGWVQSNTGDEHNATYVSTENDVPIPVPQSDFDIEINSSNHDHDNATTPPGQEISLTSSTSITIPIEPRILTIDSRMTSDSNQPLHSPPSVITTTITNMPSDASIGDNDLNVAGASLTGQTDFTSLMAAASRSNLMQQVADQQTLIEHGELQGTQFIQTAGDIGNSGGPLYVMIPPNTNSAEILQAMQQRQGGQRQVIPRLSSGALISPPTEDNRKQKEYVRKQTHNEVERRRRDRINELIKTLAEIVPGCQKKDAASGSIVGYVYSKGTVLEKTVEYVKELLIQNEQLSASVKLAEKSSTTMAILQNQITVLEKENTFLRTQMVQLGIDGSSANIGARTLLSNPLAQSLLNTQVQVPTPVVPNTTQLLVSLAQTLTSNPLLSSLSHHPTLPSTANNGTQVAPTNISTGTNNNQANLLMNSLVQTLASMSSTNSPSPPQPPPPLPNPQSSGLSAAAAMSLLNSLIAQSASTTQTSPAIVTSNNSSVNLLVTQNSPDKSTPT